MFNAPPQKLTKGNEYVPTWQMGHEQPTPQDYGHLQREGFRGNSLMYSCIRSKATSFAGLPWVLATKTADGIDKTIDAQVIELLDHPNAEEDGDEFQYRMAVALEASGNVYVQKVRRSLDFPERRTWPVKELRLIRSDYVEIVPGKTRADDVFVVKVDGQEKARHARKDIIHIKEPDPSNDFYGLSKIAVLLREGDLDQRMTDFERAFFINAGVPMGILLTKTRVDAAEKRELGAGFKRAVTGVRNWFNLLILNAEEAKYQQLGIPQSDMEAEKTREHVESRICAVFGVPPIIVGANVGLKHSTYANYNTALYTYWTETMIPMAKFIAGPMNRELWSEFRGSADRNTALAFDFDHVEALQSDNSAKLTAAATLLGQLKGSPITVNSVFGLAGLPALEGGDVPLAAPAAPLAVAPPQQASYSNAQAVVKRLVARSFIETALASRMDIIDQAAPEIMAYLQELAGRVAAGLGKSRKDVFGELVPPEEEAYLLAVILPYWLKAVESGWRLASMEIRIEDAFDIDDPAIKRLVEKAGERIQGITQETRELVQRHMAEAIERGYSIDQIVNGVLADDYPALADIPAFTESRARMIARTEMSIAQNGASVSRWRSSGMVREVTVYDGDGCGWTSHDDPDKADGSVRTLDEFDAWPVAHPHCIRGSSPIVSEALSRKPEATKTLTRWDYERDEDGNLLRQVAVYE